MADDDGKTELERKAVGVMQLKKSLDFRKKRWLLKNKLTQQAEKNEEGAQARTPSDSQKCAQAELPLLKDWHERLKKKYLCQQAADIKKKDHEVEIVNKLLKEQLETRRLWKKKVKKLMQPKVNIPLNLPSSKLSQEDVTGVLLSEHAPPSQDTDARAVSSEDGEKKFNDSKYLSDSDEEVEELSDVDDDVGGTEMFLPVNTMEEGEQYGILSPDQVEELRRGPIAKPFSLRPAVALFKDYNVCQTNTKKVILTNVSSGPLKCKLIGISEQASEIIKILLIKVQKTILVGMSCKLVISFTPKEDIDLDDEIWLSSEAGNFVVPLQIRKKFSSIVATPSELNFGSLCVGLTKKKTVCLTNNGAKDTYFQVSKYPAGQRVIIPSRKMFRLVEEHSKSFDDQSQIIECSEEGEGSINEEFMTETFSESLFESEEKSGGFSQFTAGSPTYDLSVDSLDLDGICLGEVQSGVLGGYASTNIPVSFCPDIPSRVDTYIVIKVYDVDAKEILIHIVGEGKEPPVVAEQQSYDLRICALDHHYQDTMFLTNRGGVVQSINVDIPKSVRSYLDILPRSGLVQPAAKFSLQIKFCPRASLLTEDCEFLDKDVGVIEVPIKVQVSNQPLTITITISAIISKTDVTFKPQEIDFGSCYINEALKTLVQMRNTGIITQSYGFVELPEGITIHPNDGFGQILAKESIGIEITFEPHFAMPYKFNIVCKTNLNRTFTLKCKAVALIPLAYFTMNHIKFAATALNFISSTTTYIKTTKPPPKTDPSLDLSLPVTFRFTIEPESPFQITPMVGTIEAGKPQKLCIVLKPQIRESDIGEKAVELVMKRPRSTYRHAIETASLMDIKEGSKKAKVMSSMPKFAAIPIETSHSATTTDIESLLSKAFEPPDPTTLKGSREYAQAAEILIDSFDEHLETYIVHCSLYQGRIEDLRGLEEPPPVHSTIVLELNCPIVRPKLRIEGSNIIDFGPVCVGQRVVHPLALKNISDEDIEVCMSCLDPFGPFSVLNAARKIPLGDTFAFKLACEPTHAMSYVEFAQLCSFGGKTNITLQALGVEPKLSLPVRDTVIDMGYVILGEVGIASFLLENGSSVPVECEFQLVSKANPEEKTPFSTPTLYAVNYNETHAFYLTPCNFVLHPFDQQIVTASFRPDHDHTFHDQVKLVLFNKETFAEFELTGIGSRLSVHVDGADVTILDMDPVGFTSIKAAKTVKAADDVPKEVYQSVITTKTPSHTSVAKGRRYSVTEARLGYLNPWLIGMYMMFSTTYIEGKLEPVTRELVITCIQSRKPSAIKKYAEFYIENNTAEHTQLGFSVDPQKGTLDCGGPTKVLTIKWAPEPDMLEESRGCISSQILLKVRTDNLMTYHIMVEGKVPWQ